MGIRSVAVAAAGVLLAACITSPVWAQAPASDGAARLIVKLRPTANTASDHRRQAQATIESTSQNAIQSRTLRARGLAQRTGLSLRDARDLGNGMVGLTLGTTLAGDVLNETLQALRADPDVEFAEVDHRRYVRAVPSDPLFASQWFLRSTETSATNFESAWDTTTGAADTVIAVLDTGIRFEHPDLAGRVLPGRDFVSGESSTSFVGANDGNGWDSDASDPGDWVTLAETQSGPLAGQGCDDGPSSWHGTRVAGLIGAATNNGVGMAGGTWNGRVLPVRVLGKCGGFDSDIISGMRWAAGLVVSGVPTNPNPAQILNVSLGGGTSCAQTYRTLIAELTTAGVLVVASAGNDGGPVEAPARCPGVLAVAGLRHVGTKVGYSSLGSEVGVAAPAGNCPESFRCEYSLITATNSGATGPVSSTYTDEFNYNVGTSFSAPIVSAIAGLMHGVNDGLTAAEVVARVKASARPFPAPQVGLPTCPNTSQLADSFEQCNCTTTTCGAGIADAPGAVAEALRPMARIVAPPGTGAGQNVTLNGSGSAAARNRTLSSYSWSAVSGSPTFVGATNGQNATVAVPASGQVTVRLTVTDDVGRTDARDVTLGTAASGGGGGGGASDPLVLLALGLLLARRRANDPEDHSAIALRL